LAKETFSPEEKTKVLEKIAHYDALIQENTDITEEKVKDLRKQI